ncbi:MAG: TlpA family protein disulfide reductase [Acetobacteraceae bacterium]
MTMLTRRGLLAGGTLAAGLAARKPARAASVALRLLHPPRPAPALSWQTATGASQSLAAWRGQGVVLNLWATWCPPCVAEMPSLARLAHQLAGHHVVVLPVSLDQGGAKRVQGFFAAHHITGLPVLLDPDNNVPAALGVQGVPTSFLISPAGMILAQAVGPRDWSAPGVAAQITRLLA